MDSEEQRIPRRDMAYGKRPPRRLSTGLITAGIVLLVVVGGYLILSQVRAPNVP